MKTFVHRRTPYSFLALCILGLLLVSPLAKANEGAKELIGVWRGTIGKAQVVACWDGKGGNYYRLHKPLRISLSAPEQENGPWIENKGSETTRAWQLENSLGKQLKGVWRKSDTGPKLPIRLSRVMRPAENQQDGQGCLFTSPLHDAFNAPRVAAQEIHVGEPIELMGRSYRVIQAMGGNVASVELLGEEESISRANRILHRSLVDDIGSYLDCEVFDPPEQGSFATKVKLRFWNEDWLSWSSHAEGYCGGAHPFFGTGEKTLDLRTGKEVNLWRWFKLAKKEQDNPELVCEFLKDRCLPKKLAKRVSKTKTGFDDPSCKNLDFLENVDGGYSLGLNSKGLAFIPALAEPARIMRTCYANYTIPFADLLPYLNQTGQAAVNQIIAAANKTTQQDEAPAASEVKTESVAN
jgi:hypothetical protein